MKTKEFTERAESLGYTVAKNSAYTYLYKEQMTVVGIGVIHQYALDIMAPEKMTFQVFNLVTEYAQTPLAEREEEKRYRLRLVTSLPMLKGWRYLNQDTELVGEEYFIHNEIFSPGSRSIFTESEISQMDITGFEKIEVSE